MSEHFDQEREQEHERVKEEVDQRLRCALIELGDLQEMSDRIHSVGERLARLAPDDSKRAAESDGLIRPHHDGESA